MQRLETKTLKELPRFLKLKGENELVRGETDSGCERYGLVQATWNGHLGWTNSFIFIFGEIPESVLKAYQIGKCDRLRELPIILPAGVRRLVVESYVERGIYRGEVTRNSITEFLGYENKGGVITFKDSTEVVINSRFYQFLNKYYRNIQFWGSDDNYLIELRHAGETIGCIMGRSMRTFSEEYTY